MPDGYETLDATSQLRVEQHALRHPDADLTSKRAKEASYSRIRREGDTGIYWMAGLSRDTPPVAAQAHSGVQLIPLKHDEFGDRTPAGVTSSGRATTTMTVVPVRTAATSTAQ